MKSYRSALIGLCIGNSNMKGNYVFR